MNCSAGKWNIRMHVCFVCLFDLILYVPPTIFLLNRDGSSWVEPVLSYDKCVLLKDHKAGTPLRLKPAASRGCMYAIQAKIEGMVNQCAKICTIDL